MLLAWFAKVSGTVFEELKMLEELDLDFEDLVLLGGLPKFEIIYTEMHSEAEASSVDVATLDLDCETRS